MSLKDSMGWELVDTNKIVVCLADTPKSYGEEPAPRLPHRFEKIMNLKNRPRTLPYRHRRPRRR